MKLSIADDPEPGHDHFITFYWLSAKVGLKRVHILNEKKNQSFW